MAKTFMDSPVPRISAKSHLFGSRGSWQRQHNIVFRTLFCQSAKSRSQLCHVFRTLTAANNCPFNYRISGCVPNYILTKQ